MMTQNFFKRWQILIARRVVLGGAAAVLAALSSAQAQPRTVVRTQDSGPEYAPGEVLIEFKRDATDAELGDAVRLCGLTVKKQIHTQEMRRRGQGPVQVASTRLSVAEAVQALQNHPGVRSVQPNWFYRHQVDANDPYYTSGNLWGMYGSDAPAAGPAGTTNPYGSQAENPWASGYTGSSSVYVGIIDEGLQFDHPDLGANIWTNPGEIPGNGIDDDNDGYVDDVHGWNALSNNGNIYDPASDDHGTHVAGTIGAVGGNGLGVVGINWNVTMISGKFLGPNGGYTSDAIEAIDYMTNLKVRKGLNIVALNASWGGGGYDGLLLDAIVRAARQNILFIAAAGNGNAAGVGINNDTSPSYPASYTTASGAGYDSVIAVAAIDGSGAKAPWSNYGAQSVDLGAPGVTIYSTLPNNSYGAYSGTSMATPHVTGAAALYASTHPGQTALQIKNAILGAVTPTPSLAGITITGGRLNLSQVVFPPAAPTLPAAPSGLTAAAVSSSQINISWVDNSGNEDGFKVERSFDGVTFSQIAVVPANTTSYANTGLAAGTTCSYRVRSYNAAGDSSYSGTATATTSAAAAIPAAPSNLTAVANGRGRITLSWTDNSNNETGFRVERSIDNINFVEIGTVGANVTAVYNSGLPRGYTFYYRVRAYNGSGASGYSNTAYATAK